jgi:hypothetical protein
MYAFHELCGKEDYPFCYLLGVLKRMPREADLCANFFTDQFESLLNVEEQSDTVRQTQKRSPLIKNFIVPTAPLTMTPAWSPFPLAFSVLPRCVLHGREPDGSHRSAFAIWQPELASVGKNKLINEDGKVLSSFTQQVSGEHIEFENVHARHFFWLLEMTVVRAQEMKRQVVLAGVPGFSYKSAVAHDKPPHTRLRLLQSGYLYPSRVPQAARHSTSTE